MIRIFITTVQADGGIKLIKRYFIKTVMMWAVEIYSPKQWNSHNFISVCVRIIHTITEWLHACNYPMYFVTDCNLCDLFNKPSAGNLISYLFRVTDVSLSFWFVNKYIRQCAEQCDYVCIPLIANARTLSTLQNAIDAIVSCRCRNLNEISFHDLQQACSVIQEIRQYDFPSLAQSLRMSITELRTIDSRLLPFFLSIFFLNIASQLERGNSVSRFSQALLMLVQSQELNTTAETCSIVVCQYFQLASRLMQMTRLQPKVISTSLLQELSIVYLHMALECNNIGCCKFNKLAHDMLHVYLACLYYATERYKTASRHCLKAIKSTGEQGHEIYHIERHVLPRMDDLSENVFGLVLFYRFLRGIETQHRAKDKAQFDGLNKNCYAYYLSYLCLANGNIRITFEQRSLHDSSYTKCFRTKQKLSIADILLFCLALGRRQKYINEQKLCLYSVSHKFVTLRKESVKFKAGRLTWLTVQSAVDQLNVFCLLISRDYNSVCTIMPRDYQAMYAYKCGFYEQCLRICEPRVEYLLFTPKVRTAALLTFTKSILLMLLDDDCVSLIGLATLCGVFDIDISQREVLLETTLSLYLFVQCKLRLRHSRSTFSNVLNMLNHVRFLDPRKIINPALLTFVYFKAVCRLHMIGKSHQRL